MALHMYTLPHRTKNRGQNAGFFYLNLAQIYYNFVCKIKATRFGILLRSNYISRGCGGGESFALLKDIKMSTIMCNYASFHKIKKSVWKMAKNLIIALRVNIHVDESSRTLEITNEQNPQRTYTGGISPLIYNFN